MVNMTEKDDKKANVLVTFIFPKETNICNDVDTELIIQQEIAKVMHKLVSEKKISHFVIADDDIISEKLAMRL